jgi:adenylate kinase family enzyme
MTAKGAWQRIVTGHGGSGKSTQVQHRGEELRLPTYDLNPVHWH